jgi:hypothetical protein
VSRLLVGLVALVGLLPWAAPAAAAALVDPTETVGTGRIRLDVGADLVLDRDLRFEDAGVRRESEARRFLLSGTYGLLPELDGFLTLGASRLRLTDENALPTGRFDGEVGFAFGGGLRYRFLDQRLFKVGAQLGLARLESRERGVAASWIEYDLLLATSLHVFRDLVPYLGLGASIVDGEFEGPFGRIGFRQENVIGALVGVSYAATAQVKATLAGRVFDQTTVAFTLSFGF